MLILGSQIIYNKSLIPVFNITNTLTNCTSDNDNSTITAFNTYIANIHADSGYTLEGATVSIIMDGVDITSTAYDDGYISISNVTGNIIIAITAVQGIIATPASYFKFSDDSLIGFSAEGKELYDNGELTEIIIPLSYSIGGSQEEEITFYSSFELEEFCENNGYDFTCTIDGLEYTVNSREDFDDYRFAFDDAIFEYGSITITVVNTEYIDGNDYQVTTIGQGAFYQCTLLTSVTIPYGITTINAGAFRESGLTGTLTIPNSVTTMGNYVFERCANISGTLIIPNSIISTGASCFSHTGINSLIFEEGITNIFSGFYNCTGLTSVTIPSTATTIQTYAFRHCTNLTSINIPSSVTRIEDNAFQECTGLITANIYSTSNSRKPSHYSYYPFYQCSSSLVLHIPSSVTNPTEAYGRYWNYYSSNGTLTYYADL